MTGSAEGGRGEEGRASDIVTSLHSALQISWLTHQQQLAPLWVPLAGAALGPPQAVRWGLPAAAPEQQQEEEHRKEGEKG